MENSNCSENQSIISEIVGRVKREWGYIKWPRIQIIALCIAINLAGLIMKVSLYNPILWVFFSIIGFFGFFVGIFDIFQILKFSNVWLPIIDDFNIRKELSIYKKSLKNVKKREGRKNKYNWTIYDYISWKEHILTYITENYQIYGDKDEIKTKQENEGNYVENFIAYIKNNRNAMGDVSDGLCVICLPSLILVLDLFTHINERNYFMYSLIGTTILLMFYMAIDYGKNKLYIQFYDEILAICDEYVEKNKPKEKIEVAIITKEVNRGNRKKKIRRTVLSFNNR